MAPAACHTPTCAKIAKINAPAGQLCLNWAYKAPRVSPAACSIYQHVPKWQKSIMFGPQHAPKVSHA
jgi:hypothetical protein